MDSLTQPHTGDINHEQQSLLLDTSNGLGIAEGGDFFAQNFNRNTAVQILQKS
jgi:hypothetical protein